MATDDPGASPTAQPDAKPWSVYVVRSRDGALYTGIATDVARRLAEHEAGEGRGAKALRGRGPLALVLAHEVGELGRALRIEGRIKRLPKARKEQLIAEGRLIHHVVDGMSLDCRP